MNNKLPKYITDEYTILLRFIQITQEEDLQKYDLD